MWHIPTLKPDLKQMLLSASANALKISQKHPNVYESLVNIHKSCKTAHPEQNILYKHSILLHKLYNTQCPEADWIELNYNQTLTSRETTFRIIKSNNFLVGNNLLSSCLTILNTKIPLEDLNLSLDSFKVKYKKEMLTTVEWIKSYLKINTRLMSQHHALHFLKFLIANQCLIVVYFIKVLCTLESP